MAAPKLTDKGNWTPATNTPSLGGAWYTGKFGDYYTATESGFVDLGQGVVQIKAGDQVVYGGSFFSVYHNSFDNGIATLADISSLTLQQVADNDNSLTTAILSTADGNTFGNTTFDDVTVTGNLIATKGSPQIRFIETDGTPTNEWRILIDDDRFFIREHGSSNTRLEIKDGGDVLIYQRLRVGSTTAPAYALDVTGTVNTNAHQSSVEWEEAWDGQILSGSQSGSDIVLATRNNGNISFPISTSGTLQTVTDAGNTTSNVIQNSNGDTDHDALHVRNSSAYAIGFRKSVTHGHLNGSTMAFSMNANTSRGWWWTTSDYTKSNGAMSLTTDGRLTTERLYLDDATLGASTMADARLIVGGEVINSSAIAQLNGFIRVGGDIYAHAGIGFGGGTDAYIKQSNNGSYPYELQVESSDTVASIRLEASGGTAGYVYGNSGSFGFLDSGRSWAYLMANDNYHSWRTNGNQEHMRLTYRSGTQATLTVGTDPSLVANSVSHRMLVGDFLLSATSAVPMQIAGGVRMGTSLYFHNNTSGGAQWGQITADTDYLTFSSDDNSIMRIGATGLQLKDTANGNWSSSIEYEDGDGTSYIEVNNRLAVRASSALAFRCLGTHNLQYGTTTGVISISDINAIQGDDSWLRLNNSSGFSSGVYAPTLFQSGVGTFQRDSNDKYVIGTTTHSWYLDGALDMRLKNDGDLFVRGDVVLKATTTLSDERYKDILDPITDQEEYIRNGRFVRFKWKKDGKLTGGYIAQDLQKYGYDHSVKEWTNFDNKKQLVVDNNILFGIFGAELKWNRSEHDKLEQRIKELEDELQQIRRTR